MNLMKVNEIQGHLEDLRILVDVLQEDIDSLAVTASLKDLDRVARLAAMVAAAADKALLSCE